MPTKQQVYEQRRALDQAENDAADRKVSGEVERVVKAQRAARQQLVVDCEASSGHVFPEDDTECVFCGAAKDAAARIVARNVTTAA